MADTIERLKELKEMLDGGLITQQEFNELKARELSKTNNVGMRPNVNQYQAYQNNTSDQFKNQSINNTNIKPKNNSGYKKLGIGCLVAFLIFAAISFGVVFLMDTFVETDAEKEQAIKEEQERVDALEQIVDIESYYHMSIEDFVALHGEPNREEEIAEGEINYYYDEFRVSFSGGECDIFTYLAGAEIMEMKDAFVLFGIEPNENTIEVEWSDIMNDYFIQDVNDTVKGLIVKVSESNKNHVEEFSVFFR